MHRLRDTEARRRPFRNRTENLDKPTRSNWKFSPRGHTSRLVNLLVRPALTTPADARSLQRMQAIALRQQINVAMAKPMSAEAKAHLSDSLDSLSEALKAPMQRTGA